MTARGPTWTQNMRNEERKEDQPPFSRVFVVCSKQLQVEDLRPHFEEFGEVEGMYMPRDRATGESKGVAYIKFSKTSSAAAAIENLHLKNLSDTGKRLKVMVAANKNDSNPSNNEDKYKRLFIKVHKEVKKEEILEHFLKFGQVESVYIHKDRDTDANKGFAYVNFTSFLGAAKAYEDCDRKYRAVFATPKDELKRSRNSLDSNSTGFNYNENNLGNHIRENFHYSENVYQSNNVMKNEISSPLKTPSTYTTVLAICSPQVPQKYIENLFNIVPGMLECRYSLDSYNGLCRAVITYESETKASYAVERLNNFEFPSGEIISVRPDDPLKTAANNLTQVVNSFKNSIESGNPDLLQLADAIAQASSLIKAATSVKTEVRSSSSHDLNCSINLPPPQPMASSDSRVAQRCFIVCKPQPPPIHVLRDVFCRFGDLIDVCKFPNKTFGFAKYASIRAAQDAIRTLNGAMIGSIQLKVCEADEKPREEDRIQLDDRENYSDPDMDRKRIKLYDDSRSDDTRQSLS